MTGKPDMNCNKTNLKFPEEDAFVNENGYKIYCKYWSTKVSDPKGLVFVSHGAGGHCSTHGELEDRLTDAGYFVFAHDHQGHGLSEGPRVHISDFRHYSRDVLQHCKKVRVTFPKVPVFLLGQSMGGAVSIMSVLDNPDYFTGMILVAPVVTPDINTAGPIRIFLGKMIAKVLPHFPVLYISPGDISRDKDACQRSRDDPLNHSGWMKASWALSVLNAVTEIEKRLQDITIPFLVVHGDHDKIVKEEGSKSLYEKATSSDKTIKIFPGGYHQLHNDIQPTKNETFELITSWLKSRT